MNVAFATTPTQKILQADFFIATLPRASSLHAPDEEEALGRFRFAVDVRLADWALLKVSKRPVTATATKGMPTGYQANCSLSQVHATQFTSPLL